MEEVLKTWNLNAMVDSNIDIMLTVVGSLLFAFYAVRIMSEIYKILIVQEGRFSLAQLTPIIIIFFALLAYKEIMYMIGDGFIYVADSIRNETAEKYKFSAVYESLQQSYQETSPSDNTFYGFLKWVFTFSATDFVLDFLSIPFQLLASIFALIARFCMVWFTQVAFGLMVIIGPFPLVLSLLPNMQGFASHWFKNFITVCCWNVTIAILDMLIKTLNVTYLVQFIFNGQEEFAIAMVNFIASVSYFFVPKLTSLMLGQSVVASLGAIPAAIAKTAAEVATGKGTAGAIGKTMMSAFSKVTSDPRASTTGSAAGTRYAGGSSARRSGSASDGSFNSKPRVLNSGTASRQLPAERNAGLPEGAKGLPQPPKRLN